MCATQTCASAITVLPSAQRERNASAFVTAITVIVEAFQEALAMRRAAQTKYPLGDE